jgi:hypothetical protein
MPCICSTARNHGRAFDVNGPRRCLPIRAVHLTGWRPTNTSISVVPQDR